MRVWRPVANTSRQGETPVELVERMKIAIDAHDLEGLVGCFTTDYLNETPVHPSRGFRGRDQVRRNWQQIFAGIPDVRARLVRVAADSATAWSEWELSGTRRDGSAFCLRGVAIYGVRDSLASWCRFYLEPVDEGGTHIDVATREMVTGLSGPTADREVTA